MLIKPVRIKITATASSIVAVRPLSTCVKYKAAIMTATEMRKMRSAVPIFCFIKKRFMKQMSAAAMMQLVTNVTQRYKSSIVFLPSRSKCFCSMVRSSRLTDSLRVCSSSAISWWVISSKLLPDALPLSLR